MKNEIIIAIFKLKTYVYVYPSIVVNLRCIPCFLICTDFCLFRTLSIIAMKIIKIPKNTENESFVKY